MKLSTLVSLCLHSYINMVNANCSIDAFVLRFLVAAKRTLLVASLFLIYPCFIANAQGEMVDSTLLDLPTIGLPYGELDFENIELPPISVFLSAAHNYADVKLYEEKKREEEELLSISKKQWLNYLRLQGTYQYGTNNTYLLQTGEISPVDPRHSTNTQNFYNAGVVLSIPLDDLFSRKDKNDAARSRVNQSKYELERALESRQLLILEAYNEVMKHQILLKVNAESVALYDAQMRISERDFANGRIDIIALSLERGRRTDANIKYQTSRSALLNAVSILEMLTKIKVVQTKKIP